MAVSVKWKVHTPRLMSEILVNPEMSIMRQPLMIMKGLLAEVARRAIELDDPELNALMLRLTLYEQGDPMSPAYDPSVLDGIEASLARRPAA